METAERPPLMHWTVERFIALVDSGVIPERRGIELLDGQVVAEMPQGDLHVIALRVLQRALAALGAYDYGMMVGPTIITEHNVFDPEIAFLSSEVSAGVPRQEDVLFVIEVSNTSRSYDLGRKKEAYAEAGIPHYWVVDTIDRGIWSFSVPVGNVYTEEWFVPSSDPITVPLLNRELQTGTLFPQLD